MNRLYDSKPLDALIRAKNLAEAEAAVRDAAQRLETAAILFKMATDGRVTTARALAVTLRDLSRQ